MSLPLETIETLLVISPVSQQVTENLLGPFFSGPVMRLFSLGAAIGLTYGLGYLGVLGIDSYDPIHTLVLGVFAGLGSNVVHALLHKVAPDSNASPLAAILKGEDK